MRNSTFLLLTLASCGMLGSSTQEKQLLYSYQQNAATYWEGRQYTSALDQIRRGLEIEPQDYKLRVIEAYCLLAQSQESNDPIQFKKAADAFDLVMGMRSSEKLEPKAWLGYALAQQRLGLEQFAEADRLREDLKRATLNDLEKKQRETKADEHEKKAASYSKNAERALDRLLTNQDLPMLAHYHLMLLKGTQKQLPAAIEHGEKYLQLGAKEQELRKSEIARTDKVGYENDQRARLQELISQEIEVRAYVASIHWQLSDHARAIEQLDRVLNLDPTRSVDYYNRARCYRAQGKPENAKRDCQKFLATTKMPPGSVQVTQAYSWLREE